MLPAFAGIVLPALPGLPLMFLVALGFGVVDGFHHLSPREVIILAVIALISVLVDHLSGVLGARWGGASGKATLAGFLGMIVGLMVLPPLGGFVGMFLAIAYVEARSGTLQKALKAATGSLMGSLAGIAVNVVLGLAFVVTFVALAAR